MGERSEMKYYQGKHIIQKTVDKFSLILVPISASWVSTLSSDVWIFRLVYKPITRIAVSISMDGKDIGHEVMF